jgi:hypothetical protein
MSSSFSLSRWWVGFFLMAGSVYGAIFLETEARSRSSFLEAERFRQWTIDPSGMARDLEGEFLKESERLISRQTREPMTSGDLRLERDILEARYSARREQSPAQRAYFSYRDVYRLYSPPETGRSRRARLLAPAAKQVWREDATRRGLPQSPSMFDLEFRESTDQRVVFSARDRGEVETLASNLRARGVSARVGRRRSVSESVGLDYCITVSNADFWRAHGQLKSLWSPDLPSVFVES